MKLIIDLYLETLPVLQHAFHHLESMIEKPALIKQGSYHVFRYENQTIKAAVIQKLARLISGLQASLHLLQGGFVQELGVILRTLDEFQEDIFFLCQAIQTGALSKLHQEYLTSFYQEEFDVPDNPLLSGQKRPTIARKKIQAALAQMPESETNPNDAKELNRTLSQAFSGYVHGASGHIMEMYGGHPPKYYLAGMLETPRIASCTESLSDYFYRGLLSVMLVSHSFGEQKVLQNLYSFRNYFEERSGKTEWEHPEKMIKQIKKKKA
ncbi:MAG: hypothetical protein EPN23_11140 [Verrucomicrobia bacterium]|nr:MAG: hypothetical protein EPN23_11140 [Verrucomicrobiota bacterium]